MLGARTLFVNPPLVGDLAFTRQGRCQEREEVLGTTKPPYTLALAAALFRDRGYEVRAVDLTGTRRTVASLCEQLDREGFEPTLIVFPSTTPTLEADVLAMAQKPVVFSHGGVKATCDTNRNLTDAEIRGIAATGGVVAIGYWDAAICDASLDGILRAILHVRDLAGIDHVALGSDWDGAVTTVLDSAGISALTAGLVRAGLSEEDIAKVMGGNAVRVLRQALPQGRGDPAP